MSDLIEPSSSTLKRNPLFWISLVVISLVLYLFLGLDRGQPARSNLQNNNSELAGEIERSLLVPPGMRARQLIEQVRNEGEPFPHQLIYDKASDYQQEGSLADAHLLFFFGAREGHSASVMKMAELSDPNIFRAENSLLDQADALQSYKWYAKAAQQGQQLAVERLQGLRSWAQQESEYGNPQARQLLLFIR